jgi:acyl dehydratase
MPLHAEELTVGQTFSAVVADDLTRTQIVQYAGSSGDYNPLHTDEPFATKVAGYPTVFAHGMLTMGMTGKVLTDWVGPQNLTSYGVRFVAQVWPGDTLTATATVDAVRDDDDGGGRLADFSIVTRNQRGEPVLTGTATARIG